MDFKRRLFTAVLIVYLAISWHSTVGSEKCSPVIGEDRPYCVSIASVTKIPSDVIFSLSRNVNPPVQRAQFNFNISTFTKFYNCLVQPKNINCTLYFENMDQSSYTYTANDVHYTENNDAQKSTDYWACSVPLDPDKEKAITCQPTVAEPQYPQCNMTGKCTSVGIIQGQNENGKPGTVIWTFPLLKDYNADCGTKNLVIQYKTSDVTVIGCSANAGGCNGSTNTVTKDCDEIPAGDVQSEESPPTALIIGIVCGIVTVIVLIVLGAFFLQQKVRKKRHSTATMTNGRSPNLTTLPSALDTDKNKSGALPSSKDTGSINTSSNNHGLVLAYDSFAVTSTTRDSVTLNGYATIADTECDSGSPLDSSDNRVGNHNDAPAETSQYSSFDGADAAGNGYSKLGEQVRNFKNPYNVLLKPKVDPKARNPVPIPDESTKQPSRYSLAQPILDSGNSRPIEVVDIVDPAHNPDKTSEKPSQKKSTNDYDYPSDEEMPVKRKDPTYFELEKEEDIAETNTTAGDTDRPYFELEKVEESDTDYGAAYPNEGFDPQE